METRKLYQQKYEAQLREWEAKVDVVHAHAQKVAAQARLDLKPHLDAVRAKLEAAKSKLGGVAKATDDAWDGVKHDADGAWHDLKASVEGAFAAIQGQQTASVEANPADPEKK